MQYIADNLIAKYIDDISINTIGVPSIVLMERAAEAVANIIASASDISNSILVICGKGNNGGDGIAIARLLHNRGYDVTIHMFSDSETITKDSKIQYNIAVNCDVAIKESYDINSYDVIVDAIFGVGLSKNVEGRYKEIIEQINASEAKVYAVDVPSGVNGSDGRIMGVAVKADVTVTFGLRKFGLVLYPGCEYAGKVIVAEDVFPRKAYNIANINSFCYGQEDIKRLLPIRKPVSNKGTYGHVLIIAGSKGMSGACYLAAKAAYRSGCGLVKIITHEDNRLILQNLVPEAIVSVYDDHTYINYEWLKEDIRWADSIVIGSGLGKSVAAKKLIDTVINNTDKATVIDGDGINIIAESNIYNKDAGWTANVILTPHLKEMSRLICNEMKAQEIHDNIIDVADRYCYNDVVLVLKDARTLVKYNNKTYINLSGNDGMATAGSGDVLAGIIGAFSAMGLDRFTAASLGVYIHGLAGDFAANDCNRYSMIASDIVDGIMEVYNNGSV